MQRSASIAQEAGVDFEHLATWITVVSERTRLAPEVIGTAMQSILARLHQMQLSGYSEDGGSTNQVQKALNIINQSLGTNLSLFEAGGREWKDAQVIFEEIAAIWNDLDDAQRALLTTQMAGTRMQDRFINLMSAMSDETDGLNRYQELLNVSMTSNGSTGKKYEVWLDSVTAAQNKFTAATEHLYQTMGATGAIKSFYSAMGYVVSVFADGMSASGGIFVWAAGIAALITGFAKLTKAISAAGSAMNFLTTGKAGLVLAAIGLAASLTTAVTGVMFGEKKEDKRPMGDIDSDITAHTNAMDAYNNRMDEVIKKLRDIKSTYGETTDSGTKYAKTIEELIDISPQLKSVLKSEKDGLVDVTDALNAATKAREEYNKEGIVKGMEFIKERADVFSDNAKENDLNRQIYQAIYENAGEIIDEVFISGTDDFKPHFDRILQDAGNMFGRPEIDAPAISISRLMPLLGIASNDDGSYGSYVGKYFKFDQDKINQMQESLKAIDSNNGTWGLRDMASAELGKLIKQRQEYIAAMNEAFIFAIGNDIDATGQQYFKTLASTTTSKDLTGMSDSEISNYFNKEINEFSRRVEDYRAGGAEMTKMQEETARKLVESAMPNSVTMTNIMMEELKKKNSLNSFSETIMRYVTYLGQEEANKIVSQLGTNMQTPEDGKTAWSYMVGFLTEGQAHILAYEKLKDRLVEINSDVEWSPDSFKFLAGEDGVWSKEEEATLSQAIFMLDEGTITIQDFVAALASGDITRLEAMVQNVTDRTEIMNAVMAESLKIFQDMQIKEKESNMFMDEIKILQDAYEKGGQEGLKEAFGGFSAELGTAILNSEPFKEMLAILMNSEDDIPITEGMEMFNTATEAAILLLKEMKTEMDDVSTEMGKYGGLFSIKEKLAKDEPIAFEDVKPYLSSDANMLNLLFGIDGESKNDIIEAALAKQRDAVTEALTAMMKEDKELQQAMFPDAETISDDMLLEKAKELATRYIEQQEEALRESLEEKNPYAEYIKEALMQINEGTVADMFSYDNINGVRDMFVSTLTGEGGRENFLNKISSLSGAQAGTQDAYMFEELNKMEGFTKMVYELESGLIDSETAAKRLIAAFSSHKITKANEEIQKSVDILDDIKKGGKTAGTAYQGVITSVNKLDKAYAALNFIMGDTNKESEGHKEALSVLSEATGLADESLYDTAMVMGILAQEASYTEAMLSNLAMSAINVGNVSIDPNGLISPLSAVAIQAGSAEAQIIAMLNTLAKSGTAKLALVDDGKGGKKISVSLPKLGRSGGGGGFSKKSSGGGGGGGDKKSLIDTLLEGYTQQGELANLTREIVQMTASLHEARGELTAVNTLLRQEYKLVEAQDKIDRQYLETIKAKLAAGGQSEEDTEKLKEAHAEYSKKLVQNKADLEELTRTIEENRKAIRQAEIDLRTLLHEAMMASVELKASMLTSRQEMEEQVLATIRARYEKEWELIQEDIDRKKQALEDEKRLINERLQERKKAAEEEDKYRQLADLEQQLARISADPTRAKDQLALQNQIAALREELSWKIAEDEVAAQEKSIDQQVESLDDYKTWMEKYYEDLLNHPIRLAEEMINVFKNADAELVAWLSASVFNFSSMTEEQQRATVDRIHQLSYMTTEEMTRWMSDNVSGFVELTEQEQFSLIESVRTMAHQGNAEVISWLMANNEEFRNATEVQKMVMQQGWTETMMSMRGATQTYWKEVEEIIKQGDDAIIKFLMDNHSDYRHVGKLQAEAYVDEWRKMLADLKAMYRDTTEVGIAEFNRLQSAKGVPGTGSTGGGTGAGSNPQPPTERYGLFSGGVRTAGPFSTLAEAQAALDRLRKKAEDNVYNAAALVRVAYTEQERGQADSAYRIAINGRNVARMTGIQAYSTGGLNDYTGLAMMHGTPSDPELVLNAPQTEIFRDFVKVLMRLPSLSFPSVSKKSFEREADSYLIENLYIDVASLDTEQDLEELSQRVAKTLQRATTIKMGMPVGTTRL